jgi:hypothetical protein
MPEKDPSELAADESAKKAETAALVKKAREESMKKQAEEKAVADETKRLEYEAVKRKFEDKLTQVRLDREKAANSIKEQKKTMDKEIKVQEAVKKAQVEEQETEQKQTVMRSALVEAQKNLAEALRFIDAVNSGSGDQAYRSSFLFKEHQRDGFGGPGGLAQLSGVQFSMPYLTKLNEALAAAKTTTDFPHMKKVQTLLDAANEHVDSLERKWKADEAHRASIAENMKKDAVNRVMEKQRKAEAEVAHKKREELNEKELERKAEVKRLNQRTEDLKTQAAKLEEEYYAKAANKKPESKML